MFFCSLWAYVIYTWCCFIAGVNAGRAGANKPLIYLNYTHSSHGTPLCILGGVVFHYGNPCTHLKDKYTADSELHGALNGHIASFTQVPRRAVVGYPSGKHSCGLMSFLLCLLSLYSAQESLSVELWWRINIIKCNQRGCCLFVLGPRREDQRNWTPTWADQCGGPISLLVLL